MRLLPSLLPFVAAVSATALAQTPLRNTLLLDINQQPASGTVRGSGPRAALAQPTRTLFQAAAPGIGYEVWATDGTPGSVSMITEITTGNSGVSESVVLPNGTVVLSSDADGVGYEPFAIAPGANSYTPLGDLSPGPTGSNPRALTVWGGEAWFLANDGGPGYRLYRTNGTTAGTRMVETLLPTAARPNRTPRMDVGNGGTHLYISFTETGSNGDGLYVKTAANAPSRALTVGGNPIPDARLRFGASASLNTGLVFTRLDPISLASEPWFTDGTSAGTIPLGPLNPGGPVGSTPMFLGSDGARVWFDATTAAHGTELWTTDGTRAGTNLLIDLVPGPTRGREGRAFHLLPNGDAVFGGVLQGFPGPTVLYRSNGTAAGTRTLSPTPGNVRPVYPGELTLANGLLWTFARGSSSTDQLFSYDPVADLLQLRWTPTRLATRPDPLQILGDTPNGLLLAVNDSFLGSEPWTFDPSTDTASLLSNLYPDGGTLDSRIGGLGTHAGKALFHAADGTNGPQIYATDGTRTGTRRITRHLVSPLHDFEPVTDTELGFLYFFEKQSGGFTTELWITDATTGGETLLADMQTGSSYVFPYDVLRLQDRVLFRIYHSNPFGFRWWITDGTPAGTRRFTEFAGFPQLALEVAHEGLMWGTNREAATGTEPWVSDGTTAGTRLLLDIKPGGLPSFPRHFTPIRSGVLFAVDDGTHGAEPWISDGTAAGTHLLVDLYPGVLSSNPDEFVQLPNQDLLFVADSTPAPYSEIWRTDGTGASTVPIWNLTNEVADLTAAGDLVYFWQQRPTPRSIELWRTDGTSQGTFALGAMLDDLLLDDAPTIHVPGSGREVIFQASSGSDGREFWITDGTVAGTLPLTDSETGPGDSLPDEVLRAGNRIAFTAQSLQHGRELHAIPLAPTGAVVAETFGEGCGADLEANGAPRLGQTLTLDVSTAPSALTALLFGLDRDRTTLAAGCFRHLAAPVTVGVAAGDASGNALFALAVPNIPALTGDLLHFQAFTAVPGGPLFGSVAGTPGLEVVIGR